MFENGEPESGYCASASVRVRMRLTMTTVTIDDDDDDDDDITYGGWVGGWMCYKSN